MSHTADRVLDQLRDERGRRVMLVSHCLLNENTRYAGGATRPGAVAEVVEPLLAAGYGIHQLPCPERLAWGGVLKRHSFLLYGSRGTARYRARRPLLTAFLIWTRSSTVDWPGGWLARWSTTAVRGSRWPASSGSEPPPPAV